MVLMTSTMTKRRPNNSQKKEEDFGPLLLIVRKLPHIKLSELSDNSPDEIVRKFR